MQRAAFFVFLFFLVGSGLLRRALIEEKDGERTALKWNDRGKNRGRLYGKYES